MMCASTFFSLLTYVSYFSRLFQYNLLLSLFLAMPFVA